MTEELSKGRPGVRKGLPGYYTAKQAQERLGLDRNHFNYYVKAGKIQRYVPPMRREGFYSKKEINRLATELELFFNTAEEEPETETRVAKPGDAPEIVDVLLSFGWQTTTPEQRITWYQVNPFIDYVVTRNGHVVGYVNAAPYKAGALADMMSGKKRSWDILPKDIHPYTKGKTYDLYVGIAVRQDVPYPTRLGFRLLTGFINFLIDLAQEGIIVRHLYAVSAEPDGQKLCRDLGFVEQPARPGDLFPRYFLDMETSDSHFAQRYREAVEKKED